MKTKLIMPDGEIVEKDIPMFKTPWNHDTNFESERTGLYCKDPSLTKQEFKDETDINVIIDRVMKGGDLPPPVLPEHFTDLSDRTTYHEMATRIAEANSTFYLLDAGIRAEHSNDPARWADAVVRAHADGNGDALLKLGLTLKEKPQEPKTAKPPVGGAPAPTTPAKAPEAPKGAPKD